MNMIVKATEHACQWILRHSRALDFQVFSGSSSEKRASGALFSGGKGKKAVAGALLPASLLKHYLHVSPAELVEMWRHTVLGHLQAGAPRYYRHFCHQAPGPR